MGWLLRRDLKQILQKRNWRKLFFQIKVKLKKYLMSIRWITTRSHIFQFHEILNIHRTKCFSFDIWLRVFSSKSISWYRAFHSKVLSEMELTYSNEVPRQFIRIRPPLVWSDSSMQNQWKIRQTMITWKQYLFSHFLLPC